MKVENIAAELFLELGEPSSTSIPAISYYLRAQIGHINNLLFEDFYIEEVSGQFQIWDGDEIEISTEAVSVLKALYRVYDLGVQVRATMNAINSDSILEFTDNLQGSTIRKIDRNTQSRNWISLKTAEQENLNDLVGAYRMRNTEPSQTVGDDFAEGRYNGNQSYTLRNWNSI